MIRILTADEPNAITITVDGQLVDDCVDAVETCSDQAMGQGRPVHLFLRDVSHIGENGRSLLSCLAGKGVRSSASGVYTSYIVAEISKGQPQPSRWAKPGRRPHQELIRNSRKPASAVPLPAIDSFPFDSAFLLVSWVAVAWIETSPHGGATADPNSGMPIHRTAQACRSDRNVFLPDGRLYEYACRRAVRTSVLRFGTRRSAGAATLQLLQPKGQDWALFCDHYVGSKKRRRKT